VLCLLPDRCENAPQFWAHYVLLTKLAQRAHLFRGGLKMAKKSLKKGKKLSGTKTMMKLIGTKV
jgi:hypothetical protein